MTWTREQFLENAVLFRDRWRVAVDRLQVKPLRFCDLVQLLDSDFEVTYENYDTILRFSIAHRMHARFIAHPATASVASPYEPLVRVMETGGYFSVESCYIVIRDDDWNPIYGFDVTLKNEG